MFDKLFGGDPQSQGSLAAIAQILQASGPSRTPRSLYQILGSGMSAGQDATQQAQQLSQQSQLRGLQIQEAQSDMQTKEAQRKRAQEFLDFQTAYGKSRGGQQQATPMPAPQSADSAFRSMLGGAGMPSPGGASPQQPAMGGAAPAQAGMPGGAGGSRNALVQERLQYAQALRDRGFSAEANAAEDQALKLQPKVKSLEKVMQDGKAMFAPFFEDGTYGSPVPLEVAEKLVAIDRGSSTDLTNSYTGATVRSMKNSLSPAAAAANALGYANLNLSKERLNFDKQSRTAADARAERASPMNKPMPVGALKMQEDGLEKLTTATGINSQLSTIRGQIKDGALSFGPVTNLVNQGLNAAGASTESSRNFANFRVTLEKLRNDSLRLNTGVQTDGDAQREWNALFQNINDTKWVAQRLEAIEGINARGAELQKLKVDAVRGNYGREPLDFSRYDQAGSAPAAAQQPAQAPRAAQPAATGAKTATLADITETARKSGRSTAEVTAALRAKGFTIGGR